MGRDGEKKRRSQESNAQRVPTVMEEAERRKGENPEADPEPRGSSGPLLRWSLCRGRLRSGLGRGAGSRGFGERREEGRECLGDVEANRIGTALKWRWVGWSPGVPAGLPSPRVHPLPSVCSRRMTGLALP